MIGMLIDWWKLRSTREQWMLGVMIALLAVVVIWLGILRPITSGLAAARERHAEAVVRLARVESQVSAIRRLERSRPPALEGALDKVIAAAAEEAGFTPGKVEPSGNDRVDVSIASVRPVAFFSWINSLESRGILVERLSARANSDPTLAVDITFMERRR